MSDFEYEFQLAGMNKKLNEKIETIFMMSDVENQIISSKFVKEIAKLGGKIDKFLTKSIVKRLKNKLEWKNYLYFYFNNIKLHSEETMIMKLKNGNVELELYPEVAPNHVKRFKDLANKGLYDGVVFHRVIDGFMAQSGDVKFEIQIQKILIYL